MVMDCRHCNFYVCGRCHPQAPRSWLWGSISFLAEKASQEFTDLKEVARDAETMGPLAACTAPPVSDLEITIPAHPQEEETGGGATSPCTPATTTPPASADACRGEATTPPKSEAPKEEASVDLLGLDFEVEKVAATPGKSGAPPVVEVLDLL